MKTVASTPPPPLPLKQLGTAPLKTEEQVLSIVN